MNGKRRRSFSSQWHRRGYVRRPQLAPASHGPIKASVTQSFQKRDVSGLTITEKDRGSQSRNTKSPRYCCHNLCHTKAASTIARGHKRKTRHPQTSVSPAPAKNSTAMNSVASKRLFQEYKHLTTDPPEGITAGPVNEDDLFLWEAMIQGPEGTPYEGGVFPAELKFPKDYPLMPPVMKFQCDIWHPNGTCAYIPSSTKGIP